MEPYLILKPNDEHFSSEEELSLRVAVVTLASREESGLASRIHASVVQEERKPPHQASEGKYDNVKSITPLLLTFKRRIATTKGSP